MRPINIITAVSLAATLSWPARADVITDWNQKSVDVIRKLGLGPNPATRALAIAHIAAYDAVNSTTKTHQPYHAQLTPALPVSVEAAAASAVYGALVRLFPAEKSSLDASLEQSLASITDGEAKTHGLELGDAAAADIYALRLNDGASASAVYPGSTEVGQWRPTPRADLSAPLAAAEPWWRSVTPFALTTPEQFRPGPPPDITSEQFATAYLETRSLGKIDSTTRTAEQTKIATFWRQATHIPFNAIARAVAKNKQLSVAESARLFALLNITLADTRIAVWDAKYQYGYWRPITAINTVTDYGNAAALPDAGWLPLLETPNHPEYPSGHSISGGGGARVLALVFGSDTVSFAVGSDTAPGATRSFTKFSEAEQENADSRIYGGIHYRFSNEVGIAIGHQVADYVTANYLKALPNAPGGAGGEGGFSDAGASGSAGARADAEQGGTAGDLAVADAGQPSAPSEGGSAGASTLPSGGSAGKAAQQPDPRAEDDGSCSVARPGSHSSWFGSALLLGLAGLGFRARRGSKRRR